MTPSYTRTEVGQPLPVRVSVRPAFNWTNPPASEPVLLSYEINGTFDDWLVSGRKRGEFIAEVRPIPFALPRVLSPDCSLFTGRKGDDYTPHSHSTPIRIPFSPLHVHPTGTPVRLNDVRDSARQRGNHSRGPPHHLSHGVHDRV